MDEPAFLKNRPQLPGVDFFMVRNAEGVSEVARV
jgi:hypothetical protein